MSRAGKFIPGGAGRKASGGLAKAGPAPIRADDAITPDAPKEDKKGRKLFPKGGLVKPVPKKNRLPITIMSAVFLAAGVWFGQYILVTRPAQIKAAQEAVQTALVQKQLDDEKAAEKAAADKAAAEKAAMITVKIDSNPSGAQVTLGKQQKTTPATFSDVAPGSVDLTIHLDGYHDYQQKITAESGQPLDLGVIPLAQRTGSVALSAAESGMTYTLTGPNNYSHAGTLPDKLANLSVGAYQITATLGDWKIPAETFTIHPDENVQQVIKPPYATLVLQSDPAGATVRNGNKILGQTPVTLSNQRPGPLHLSFDLPPYTIQQVDLNVADSDSATKVVTLIKDKDFIAACGLPMVWIPGGNFWAAKYPMPQNEFEAVAKYNPSYFRRPSRPVENISWDNANAFCQKLTDYESKAGRLPAGYKYSLPSESQWSMFSADADINQAAMSRTGTLSSTQDVGFSEPNKYGLYDTLGNVWEWCLDSDDQGNHSLRGGSWLSSGDNFPSADTRVMAVPKNADRFTGFRVVLVPQ